MGSCELKNSHTLIERSGTENNILSEESTSEEDEWYEAVDDIKLWEGIYKDCSECEHSDSTLANQKSQKQETGMEGVIPKQEREKMSHVVILCHEDSERLKEPLESKTVGEPVAGQEVNENKTEPNKKEWENTDYKQDANQMNDRVTHCEEEFVRIEENLIAGEYDCNGKESNKTEVQENEGLQYKSLINEEREWTTYFTKTLETVVQNEINSVSFSEEKKNRYLKEQIDSQNQKDKNIRINNTKVEKLNEVYHIKECVGTSQDGVNSESNELRTEWSRTERVAEVMTRTVELDEMRYFSEPADKNDWGRTNVESTSNGRVVEQVPLPVATVKQEQFRQTCVQKEEGMYEQLIAVDHIRGEALVSTVNRKQEVEERGISDGEHGCLNLEGMQKAQTEESCILIEERQHTHEPKCREIGLEKESGQQQDESFSLEKLEIQTVETQNLMESAATLVNDVDDMNDTDGNDKSRHYGRTPVYVGVLAAAIAIMVSAFILRSRKMG